ncbi:MAG: CHC2 zinc finger domain-containing protein [Pseudomonadota bacterium]
MTQWIDFKLLKQQIRFEAVLAHYGVEGVSDGPAHVKCRCPFHEDKKPSLGIDLEKKIWQCFACKASGNVLDFITRMEGYDPAEKGAIRKGAEAAMAILGSDAAGHQKPEPKRKAVEPARQADNLPPKAAASRPDHEDGNAPLSFELKLETGHGFLKGKGIKRATLERFGVGVAKRGLMKNRVCFPLRDAAGQTLGYAGRWASNDLPEGEPLWQFPPKFNLARFVFGLDQFSAGGEPVVVLTHDYWTVLALSDASLPALCIWAFDVRLPHVRALSAHGIERVLLLDPETDEVGESLPEALDELSRTVFVKTVLAADLSAQFEG